VTSAPFPAINNCRGVPALLYSLRRQKLQYLKYGLFASIQYPDKNIQNFLADYMSAA